MVEIRFSLEKLTKIVKIILDRENITTMDNLFLSFQKSFLRTVSDDVAWNMKRRIYEILKGFAGVGVI